MENQKITGLAQLAWRADNCKITSISCKRSKSRAGSETSTMLVGGIVTLELSKNCGVCFAWRAEQLVAHFESTPGFAYSVDNTKGCTSQGLVFVGEDGEPAPQQHYDRIIQTLGRDMVTLWSSVVSHYLKSLR